MRFHSDGITHDTEDPDQYQEQPERCETAQCDEFKLRIGVEELLENPIDGIGVGHRNVRISFPDKPLNLRDQRFRIDYGAGQERLRIDRHERVRSPRLRRRRLVKALVPGIGNNPDDFKTRILQSERRYAIKDGELHHLADWVLASEVLLRERLVDHRYVSCTADVAF